MDVEITVDDGGVTAALASAATRLPPLVRPVVAKGALNIKTAMQEDAKQSRYFRLARTISYDMKGNAYYSEAQIGPEKGGAGSLANIAYFGGAHGGGGTIRDPKAALADELPKFEKALGVVIGKVL